MQTLAVFRQVVFYLNTRILGGWLGWLGWLGWSYDFDSAININDVFNRKNGTVFQKYTSILRVFKVDLYHACSVIGTALHLEQNRI